MKKEFNEIDTLRARMDETIHSAVQLHEETDERIIAMMGQIEALQTAVAQLTSELAHVADDELCIWRCLDKITELMEAANGK